MARTIPEAPLLEMKISLNALEHLGLKMYTSLPAVLAEFVANCWDAGASFSKITIPAGAITPTYSIKIADDGIGMSVNEINKKFLLVGRNRRKEDGTDTIKVRGKRRKVMGRKGIGKLAGFGVAGQVVVTACKGGNCVKFLMDYDKIQDRLAHQEGGDVITTYPPEVLDWGPTSRKDGTIVVLTHLKREREVSVPQVRRSLARTFSILGTSFDVIVNGRPIKPAERELQEDCEWIWQIKRERIAPASRLVVKGWIGTMKETVDPELGRGVVVMARGKLVQDPTTFDVGGKGITGQHALAYLVGELHAEFLDAENDLVATGRRSVVWETPPASLFREWVNKKIKTICQEWAEKRRDKKMKTICALPTYRERIANLPSGEKKMVDSFLGKMADREDVDLETIEKTADFLAGGVEYKSFLGLMDTLDKAAISKPEVVIRFFKEWEVLDAIETIRIVEGRLEAVLKFQELVRAKAREVPTLHDFIADNPWLLDSTWDYLDDELEYRDKLLERFPESPSVAERNRRIDFLCLGYGRVLNVVELKGPKSSIGRTQLEQLEGYVDHVRTLQGTDPRASYSTIVGYIIGGKLSMTREVHQKAERLLRDSMYVRTYRDLERGVMTVNGRFVEILERKAKRTNDRRVIEGLERLRKAIQKP